MRKAVAGLPAWLIQRASAVVMLLFIVFALARFLLDRPHSYPAWRAWLLGPSASIATVVFFAALLAHAWIGLRDVVLDYVHPVATRVVVLTTLSLALTGVAAWVIRICLLNGA